MTDFHQALAFLSRTPMSRSALTEKLRETAGTMESADFGRKASSILMEITRPDAVIPDVYADYRPIAADGIAFFCAGLNRDRLIDILADQLLLGPSASSGGRLIALAGKIPTLHKLGQIIARNRNLAPEVRRRLIRLENGNPGTDIREIQKRIHAEIRDHAAADSVVMEPEMLSEASVGTIIGFEWHPRPNGPGKRGVFKVLRPGVRRNLKEEFDLLDRLAAWFHENRSRYALKEFRFIEIFKEVRDALSKEICLSGEQANLLRAAKTAPKRSAEDDGSVLIPRLLPFSTPNVTAMERMDGMKITDADFSPQERKTSARNLFQMLAWRPLFRPETGRFFHGDPHAGNIFAVRDEWGRLRPAMLDWSLTGTLTEAQRRNIIRLILGIAARDAEGIRRMMERLAAGGERRRMPGMIADILESPDFHHRGLMEKAFYFIDQTALRGVVYPRDLMLFRKAFFTLDGVLHDIDPDFSADACLFRLLERLFAEELPRRWMFGWTPWLDRPENYVSTVSNAELHRALFRWMCRFRSAHVVFQGLLRYCSK